MQHLFIECCVSKKLWSDIKTLFGNSIIVPDLTLQSAFFGFYSPNKDTFALNNILLIFKICMYRSRVKNQPDIQLFIKNLHERERMDRQIVLENEKNFPRIFRNVFFYQSSSISNFVNDNILYFLIATQLQERLSL